jgi:cytochrome c553
MRSRGHSRIKRIALFCLKGIYLAPIFAFGIWLISIVYLQGHEFKSPTSREKAKKDVGGFNILMPKQETVPRDHFHMIDQYVETQRDNQPVCVTCHGSYAHGKEKRVRAILNMHDGYIACAVCHARQGDGHGDGKGAGAGKEMDFLWVDRETGEFKPAIKGEYGKYPARIFPIAYSAQGAGRIFTPITAEAAQAFLDRLPGLTPDQAKQARAALHDALSKEAVSCADCHKKDGYLDFKALGFPQQRIDHLISTEFVGMIEKYKTFHLPSVIDFGRTITDP